MISNPKSLKAYIGFRVKSGWAASVLLSGSVKSPVVADSRIVNLSDPEFPETKQPYHAEFGTLEEDRAKLRRRIAVIRRVTAKSVSGLLKNFQTAGYKIRHASLVVGSVIDPASIGHPHIRAHALEGRLFRTVLEGTLRSHRLPVTVTVERNLYSKAKSVLRRPENKLRRELTDLRRLQKGPWRAVEKSAALAAWMTLK
jgi:hypothetical protein